MFYFYIIYSKAIDKFYTGYSSNYEERIIKHNQNHKGFTGRASDWGLVYKEIFKTKTEAYTRERQVKSWKSKKMIQQLIAKDSEHPDTSGGS